jgi:hypothetical protein
LKEEALNHTMWRAHFGRGFRPVVRQTTKWMNIPISNFTNIYLAIHQMLHADKWTEKQSGVLKLKGTGLQLFIVNMSKKR